MAIIGAYVFIQQSGKSSDTEGTESKIVMMEDNEGDNHAFLVRSVSDRIRLGLDGRLDTCI